MAYSSRFKILQSRFKDTRRLFLPKNFSKTGSYSNETLDRARAFRLLIHAEIESFFEERSIEIAQLAFDRWKSSRMPSAPLVALVASYNGDFGFPPKELVTGDPLTAIAAKSLNTHRHRVINNHGIRTENLLSLLEPIGVEQSQIDPAWLATTDGFASKRGDSAHKSAAGKVTYLIDPKDDMETVMAIIGGMKQIDVYLNKIAKIFK